MKLIKMPNTKTKRLTFLISSKSFEKSITGRASFEDMVGEISRRQQEFRDRGFKLGVAYRLPSIKDVSVEDIIEIASEHRDVPFRLETEVQLASLVIGNEILTDYIALAKELARYDNSIDAKDNVTLRVLYGDYSTKNGFGRLYHNLTYFNKICRENGVHLLVENIPKDTVHLGKKLGQELWKPLKLGNDPYVQLLVDIGNLTTSFEGSYVMSVAEAMKYWGDNYSLIGGWHLKQTSGGKPLSSLGGKGDFNMADVMGFIMTRKLFKYMVIEPPASPEHNLASAIEDAYCLVKSARQKR